MHDIFIAKVCTRFEQKLGQLLRSPTVNEVACGIQAFIRLHVKLRHP